MEPLQTIGIHENENKEAYQCTYCEETFMDQNYLKVHLLSHKEYQNIKRIDQGQEKYGEEDKYVALFDSITDKIDMHNEIKEGTDEDSVMENNETTNTTGWAKPQVPFFSQKKLGIFHPFFVLF